MATLLVLPTSVGDWLLELGLFDHTELDSPPVDGYVLRREASQEFENGVRVARLLQELGAEDEELDTLKEVSTPVAKLYNWNLLLPKLRAKGLDVDQDMKVLIVAGDLAQPLQGVLYIGAVLGVDRENKGGAWGRTAIGKPFYDRLGTTD